MFVFNKKPSSFFLIFLFVILLAVFPQSFFSSAKASVYQTKNPVWAFGDPHGDYDELVKTLKAAKIIDESLNWSAGNATVISIGDVLDRGPQPRKIFDLLIKLEKQAVKDGGQLLFILGNHEVLVLTGDLRYVAPEQYLEFAEDETRSMRNKYFKKFTTYVRNQLKLEKKNKKVRINKTKLREVFDKKFVKGYFAHYEAFKPEGYYGKWLMEKDFIIKVNDNLFAHAGLSKQLLPKSIQEINKSLKQELVNYLDIWHEVINAGELTIDAPFFGRYKYLLTSDKTKIESVKNLQSLFVFSNQSPTWYRGAIFCHPYYEKESTRQLMKHFDVNKVFVGHTVTLDRQINTRLDEMFYMIDTGMFTDYYGGEGNIVKISQDKVIAMNNKAETYQPKPAEHEAIYYPENISKEELIYLLQSGEFVKKEKINTGLSSPSRLTFNVKGQRVRALLKYIDTNPNLQRRKKKKFDDAYPDRHHHDIAAYQLSELMGFNLVPLSTSRTSDGKAMLAQYWVEDSYTEYTAEQKGWQYDGHCDYNAQKNMMNVFDLLIYNFDRNPTNVLVEQEQGQLLWIDHSRSFSYKRKFPRDISRDIQLTPEVREALKALNRDKLKSKLNGLLNKNQINGILKRRDLILKLDPES